MKTALLLFTLLLCAQPAVAQDAIKYQQGTQALRLDGWIPVYASYSVIDYVITKNKQLVVLVSVKSDIQLILHDSTNAEIDHLIIPSAYGIMVQSLQIQDDTIIYKPNWFYKSDYFPEDFKTGIVKIAIQNNKLKFVGYRLDGKSSENKFSVVNPHYQLQIKNGKKTYEIKVNNQSIGTFNGSSFDNHHRFAEFGNTLYIYDEINKKIHVFSNGNHTEIFLPPSVDGELGMFTFDPLDATAYFTCVIQEKGAVERSQGIYQIKGNQLELVKTIYPPGLHTRKLGNQYYAAFPVIIDGQRIWSIYRLNQ